MFRNSFSIRYGLNKNTHINNDVEKFAVPDVFLLTTVINRSLISKTAKEIICRFDTFPEKSVTS